MTAVLFDVPGPHGVARNRLVGLVGSAAVLGILGYVVYRFYDTGQFEGRLWSWLQYEQIQRDLLKALLSTLRAFAVGAVLALTFGAIFAAGRLSDHAWLRLPSMLVVEFFRAVPLLILIFLFYYGLPSAGIRMTPFWALVLGLMLYNGSVLAEVFRAGILSLPRGQSEAAYALGMRKTQVMTLVLLPQALRAMLPAIISQLVVLLKDTALGFLITYYELLRYTQTIGGSFQFGRPLIPVFIVVATIYITLCLLLTWLATYLESRNRRSKRIPPGVAPAELAPELPPLIVTPGGAGTTP
jgi:glutamate transport system permease protein